MLLLKNLFRFARADELSDKTVPDPDETGTDGQDSVSRLSFEELYALYANEVLRMCYFYLNDRQRAEDVCQDVFVKLITRKPVLREGREKAWLLKVAMNLCRDLWRGAWLKRVVLGSGTPAFESIPAPDDLDRRMENQELMAAVNQLQQPFKVVFLLHYYQGFGIAEISEILNIPEGTISSRLSRARKRLGELLKSDDLKGDDVR